MSSSNKKRSSRPIKREAIDEIDASEDLDMGQEEQKFSRRSPHKVSLTYEC